MRLQIALAALMLGKRTMGQAPMMVTRRPVDDYAGSVAQSVARTARTVRKTLTVALKALVRPVVRAIRRHIGPTQVWSMNRNRGQHREGHVRMVVLRPGPSPVKHAF
jgi:hypothetical protein